MKNIISLIIFFAIMFATGCVHGPYPYGPSHATTGALGGAAYGGLMGALIGGDERSAWTGAGIGAVGGYMIGNEYDKAYAYRYHYHHAPTPKHYAPAPSYLGNPGVQSSYHRGRSDYFRDKQREAERLARDRGRSGW